MTLPSSSVAEPGFSPAPGESHVPRRTLLIVDDEEGPRQSIRFVFKDEYTILTADSGAKAIELARQHPVDAAVLDIRMSGMSGIDVLTRLKEIDPSIEVVMLTAYETLETARQALRLGACDYLNKPFDIATLREAVRIAIERHSLAEDIRHNNRMLKQLQEDIQDQKLREEMARTRGEIYASIIHDINGPLTIISGFVDAINQRVGTDTRLEGEKFEVVKDRLSRIGRQVSNCIQISRRYLSFLHNRGGDGARVGVNQVLKDLEELINSHPSAARNKLVVEPLAEELHALINGTDLIQVLLNLVINSFQSSPDAHHVTVRATSLGSPFNLAAHQDGPQDFYVNQVGFESSLPCVAIAVQDDGPGIPPESVGRVFDSYFTTKPVGQGTGLGLSIVKRLVEQAKGAIHLHTERGKGTTFTIYLPARLSQPQTV
jgi:two-component system, sensor histidine kinase and response regulator